MKKKKAAPISDVPSTDFVGFIKIGNEQIPCAVLYPESENPIRVIVQREVVGLLTGNKKGGLERYLNAENLQPFLPEKFKDKDLTKSTHLFRSASNGRTAQGFEGEDLIDICQMYMRARTDRKLLPNQRNLATQSEIIVFAFAKTGVAGLIDNVTGFEEFRPRFALNRLFERYIEEEARKWVKRFPDKFYQLIFKLNGWPYDEETIKKRPGIVGKWTKEIIYSRFPKPILARLEDKNPIDKTGHRTRKHHQLLTDIGNEELQEYISNAMFLMEAAPNWRRFMNMLARAMGKPYEQDLWEQQ
jgi:hypothetical protein